MAEVDEGLKRKRAFWKFTYRGVNFDQLVELMHNSARKQNLKRKPMALIKKLKKAKKEAPPMEKPSINNPE
uniref:40S ribosomal protein S15 n=1 Tax=Megaselia scalaris TaxID=36166 RepID=T1GIT3_MEGSC